MKSNFIQLDCLDDTIDGKVTINIHNISTIRRVNYNDVIQTMVQMIGGERFGVNETPEELLNSIQQNEMQELNRDN